jgi:N-acetylglutamate synthase-like GNAT family acetyltransferase
MSRKDPEATPTGLRMAGTIAPLTTDASYVRRARPRDVDRILEVIGTYVEQHVLLPRTREEVVDEIDSWWVGDLNGEVVGCAALRDFGAGLGELRSLSVVAEAHGRGLGESLVHMVVREARRRSITRLFAITRNPGYFARHGFAELPMDDVPDVLQADRVPWPRRSGAGHAMELVL